MIPQADVSECLSSLQQLLPLELQYIAESIYYYCLHKVPKKFDALKLNVV